MGKRPILLRKNERNLLVKSAYLEPYENNRILLLLLLEIKMKKLVTILSLLIFFAGCPSSNSTKKVEQAEKSDNTENIEAYWKSGNTLPIEFSQQYPHQPLNIKDDTGINVLIDMAHQ